MNIVKNEVNLPSKILIWPGWSPQAETRARTALCRNCHGAVDVRVFHKAVHCSAAAISGRPRSGARRLLVELVGLAVPHRGGTLATVHNIAGRKLANLQAGRLH